MTFAVRPLQSSTGGIVYLTSGSSVNNSLAGSGGTAIATVRLSNTGVLSVSQGAPPLVPITGQWKRNGLSSEYEARGTWQNGSGGGTTGGPTGWVSLGTTRDWTFSVSNDFQTIELLIELRLVSNSMPLTSAVISVEVDSAI